MREKWSDDELTNVEIRKILWNIINSLLIKSKKKKQS